MDAAGGAIAFLGALAAAVVAVIAAVLSRRSDKEANRTQAAIAETAEGQGEFLILRGTLDAVSGELTRLQSRLQETSDDLDAANVKLERANRQIDRLNHQLDTARINISLLEEHIREHVPAEVPFPKLRRIWESNGG